MRFLKIKSLSSKDISLLCEFSLSSYWPMMESIIQGGGLHLRYLLSFSKHVFLAKIKEINFLGEFDEHIGLVRVEMVSTTTSSAMYEGSLFDKNGLKVYIGAKFLLAHRDFNEVFKKDLIISHFKGMFGCLMSTKED